MKQTLHIELSPDELQEMMRQNTEAILTGVKKEIGGLKKKLEGTKPAFDNAEAAAYCGKSPDWFYRRRSEVSLPSHKVGGTPMYKKEDLDAMLLGKNWKTPLSGGRGAGGEGKPKKEEAA